MKLSNPLTQTVLTLAAYTLADFPTFRSQINIPGNVSNDNAVAQFTSDFFGPDALKISPITPTVTGWWYFDAVDENLEGEVDVFLYYSPGLALNLSTVSVSIAAHFANGTAFDATAIAESAVITTDEYGSSGEFTGTGVSWTGAPCNKLYEIRLNSPELGVSGCITLEAVAPGHYACGPIRAGENMALAPTFGFSNAVPDGNTKVDLVLNGSSLSFTGIGYHEQRWTPVDFHESFSFWYQGHARLGPYSLVWYDGLSPNGDTEIKSAYAAKDGKIITATCGGVTVRPIGENSTYPPGKTTGNPEGFHITMDLGDEGILDAVVVADQIVVETPKSFEVAQSEWYTRWTGRINGTVGSGGEVHHGIGLFEEAVYY